MTRDVVLSESMKQDKPCAEQEIQGILLIEQVADVPIRNQYGEFLLAAFATEVDGSREDHLAMYKNLHNGTGETPLPVRINSACLSGEVLGCRRCDCKWQLDESVRYIASVGSGLLLYHPSHEGRGFGLVTKLKSYQLMDVGLSTAQAFHRLRGEVDGRRFLSSVVILRRLGIRRVNLLTNNPAKVEALRRFGIVVETVTPLVMPTKDPAIVEYLRSKRDEMGHMIPGGW